jgi:hypothetical protein
MGKAMTGQEAILRGLAYNDQVRRDKLQKEVDELEIELARKKRLLAQADNRALVGQLYVHMLEETA